jgi:hypothetical protein
LGLGGYGRGDTQNGQQYQGSDSFHNVSERMVLAAILHRSRGSDAGSVLLL